MAGYYVADERFPPGTRVVVADFEDGTWHVAHDWPEHVVHAGPGLVHIAGTSAAGVVGEAWVQADRLARAGPDLRCPDPRRLFAEAYWPGRMP